jgi:hypothetical protein
MKGRSRRVVQFGMRKRSRPHPFVSRQTAEDLRYETALALYPRYLAFMEERGGEADFPPYDFRAAAGDAVRAADYLIEAIKEGPR